MIKWIEDQILYFLQRRCDHPENMVAADILEACVNNIEVRWCKRCGAIKTDWKPVVRSGFATLEHWWRSPDPNLWR